MNATVGKCGCAPPRLVHQRLADVPTCSLPAGHAGWHRDEDTRCEWGRVWREDDHARAETLARRIEAQAAVSARPGQLAELEQIAAELRALFGGEQANRTEEAS